MAVYDTPYYGQRRRALTGESYGPYYGMSLTGGGGLPPEGGRALPPEISEKYGATGVPAITEGAEGVDQPAFEGLAFADDPGASWAIPSYALLGGTFTRAAFGKKGLDAAKEAFPSPTFKGYGTAKTAAKYGASTLGFPIGFLDMAFRTVIGPALAALLPGLKGLFSNITQPYSPLVPYSRDQPSDPATDSFAPAFSMDQFGMMDFGMEGPGDTSSGGFSGGFSGPEGVGEGEGAPW